MKAPLRPLMLQIIITSVLLLQSGTNAELTILSPTSIIRERGSTFASPTLTTFIGPQFDDKDLLTVSTNLSLLATGSACEPQPPHSLEYKAVLIHNDELFGCSYERKYTNLIETGAVAIISVGTGTPGVSAYTHDGYRGAWTRDKNVPMVEISDGIGSILLAALGDNETVQIRLRPDYNVWLDTFNGFIYTWYIRYSCGSALILNSLLAAVFLGQHIKKIHMTILAYLKHHHPYATKPMGFRKNLPNIARKLGVPHAALLVEILSTLVLGCVIIVSGINSTGHLRYQHFIPFITLLIGWSWVSSILAAVFWRRSFKKLVPDSDRDKKLCCTRPFLHRFSFALLIGGPFFLDAAVGVMLSLYFNPRTVGIVSGLTFMILQLVVAIFFIKESFRYIRESTRVHRESVHLGSDPLDMFLRRLSTWNFRSAVFMITVVLVQPIAATKLIWIPKGLSAFWSVLLTARIGISVCQVMAFRPTHKGLPKDGAVVSALNKITDRRWEIIPSDVVLSSGASNLKQDAMVD